MEEIRQRRQADIEWPRGVLHAPGITKTYYYFWCQNSYLIVDINVSSSRSMNIFSKKRRTMVTHEQVYRADLPTIFHPYQGEKIGYLDRYSPLTKPSGLLLLLPSYINAAQLPRPVLFLVSKFTEATSGTSLTTSGQTSTCQPNKRKHTPTNATHKTKPPRPSPAKKKKKKKTIAMENSGGGHTVTMTESCTLWLEGRCIGPERTNITEHRKTLAKCNTCDPFKVR